MADLDISESAFGQNQSMMDVLGGLVDDIAAVRAPFAGLLRGSATYDPASLNDGAGATTTVTVTGAALGDMVVGVSFSVDLAGVLLTAYVSATDTVSVRFQNESAGTVDLASGTIRVAVLPQAALLAPAAPTVTR